MTKTLVSTCSLLIVTITFLRLLSLKKYKNFQQVRTASDSQPEPQTFIQYTIWLVADFALMGLYHRP